MGADDRLTAISRAINKVRTIGMANPDYILMHPNDYEDIRVLKDTTGSFIFGAPTVAGPATIWGLPTVLTTIVTEGTALVGDITIFSQVYLRSDVQVEVGWVSTQFTSGMQSPQIQYSRGVRGPER